MKVKHLISELQKLDPEILAISQLNGEQAYHQPGSHEYEKVRELQAEIMDMWELQELVTKKTKRKFELGQEVMKISGSEWQGYIVGEYSTELTPEGYAVESKDHKGSVQIYPAKALKAVE